MNEYKLDNSHFRKIFFQIDCIMAIFLLMMETIYFIGWWKFLCEDASIIPQHLLIFLVTPSVLNLIILLGVVFIQKYVVGNEMLQNYAVIMALVLMDLITVFLYYKFPCTMCLFVIPIFMTAAFRDRRMTHWITGCAMVGCVAFAAVNSFIPEGGIEHTFLFPDVAIALIVVAVSDVLVLTLLEIMALILVSDLQELAKALERGVAQAVEELPKPDAGVKKAESEKEPPHKEEPQREEAQKEERQEERSQPEAAAVEESIADMPEAAAVEEAIADTPEAAGLGEETEASKPGSSQESVFEEPDFEEKVISAAEIVPEEPELSEDGKKLRQLEQQIPQINVAKGIAYCANDEHLYLEILMDFATNSALRQLTVLQQKGQWGNYQIGVRVLRTTSESLGFAELSRHTGQLEEAVQKDHYDYVQMHHEEIIAEYLKIAEAIITIVK